jgi:DNA repair exonuclease SbcCD ATPase subunit
MAQILRDKRICEADGKAVRDQLAGEKARLEIILEKEKELARDLAKEYSLELLQKAIGGNGGLTVGLLKRYIPVINEETNNVIREVFEDMEVRLEATDKDTLEVHFSRGGRPESGVGMASGSEKAAISLALRLALASVSSLPKSNIFILDEPFSSFDLSRIDDFEKILFLLKTKFDYVVLITHSDRVKDFADEIIYLSPDEAGVSSVNV